MMGKFQFRPGRGPPAPRPRPRRSPKLQVCVLAGSLPRGAAARTSRHLPSCWDVRVRRAVPRTLGAGASSGRSCWTASLDGFSDEDPTAPKLLPVRTILSFLCSAVWSWDQEDESPPRPLCGANLAEGARGRTRRCPRRPCFAASGFPSRTSTSSEGPQRRGAAAPRGRLR